MLTTEAEAKTKRCQESYPACTQVSDGGYAFSVPLTGGAYALQTAPSHCIGSACMAWRWAGWNVDPITNERIPTGFCGKAGRP